MTTATRRRVFEQAGLLHPRPEAVTAPLFDGEAQGGIGSVREADPSTFTDEQLAGFVAAGPRLIDARPTD